MNSILQTTPAHVLWDYLVLDEPLTSSEVILVQGSYDTRVIERGIELFNSGMGNYLLITGGRGRLSSNSDPRSEAEVFSEYALKAGLPESRILIEKSSTNTQENILFSRALLEEKNIHGKIIAIQVPYGLRRAKLTFQKRWPEVAISFTGPTTTFESYPNEMLDQEELINLLTGEISRLKTYPEKGFIPFEEIPSEVTHAYESLVNAGYVRYVQL